MSDQSAKPELPVAPPAPAKAKPLTLIESCERDVEMLTTECLSLQQRGQQLANELQQIEAILKDKAALRRSKIDTLLAEKPGYADPDVPPAPDTSKEQAAGAKIVERALRRGRHRKTA